MLTLLIKKWIEPYKLLETIKEISTIENFAFDGSNKNILKAHFLKQLNDNKSFGLYMKNVNKFYIFDTNENLKDLLVTKFQLSESDYEVTEDEHRPFEDVDAGRVETSIIMI